MIEHRDADLTGSRFRNVNLSGTRVHCVHVVLHEEWWHHQYAARDLAILEERLEQAPVT